MDSIGIIDGQSKELTKNAIPDILSDALAVPLIGILVMIISMLLLVGMISIIESRSAYRLISTILIRLRKVVSRIKH